MKPSTDNIYPSERSVRAAINQTLSELIQLPHDRELSVDDVRIEPAFMVFEDAYSGKKFAQKLTLRNYGKNAAFVRILLPKSRAFTITTLEKGFKLRPGLSIVRIIKYTHNIGNAEFSSLPIKINGKAIDYNLKVKLSASVISVEPNFIDFGEFATWQSPEFRNVSLKNTGSRSALFAIDTGNNELDLLVEPRKGVVSAGSKVTLRIEIMGTRRGTFVQEFWIKCVTPMRVQVSVTFVEQKLLSYHPHIMTDFTMVDFPRTYFGTKIMKTMVLINKGPVAIMYCSKVRTKTDLVDIKEAAERGHDIRCFNIWPNQGRIAPYESKVCEVVYTPIKTKKTRNKEKFDNYATSFLHIEKVAWKDMFNVVFEDNCSIDNVKQKSVDKELTGSNHSSLEDITDDFKNTSSISTLEDFSVPSLNYIKSVTHIESVDVQQPFRGVCCCLYGEGETANVTLQPNQFHLGNLDINQTVTRELLLFNNSQVLAIIFQYNKVPFIEVLPKQGTIPPEKGKEVLIKITPGRYGLVKTKVAFHLLHYNFPRKEGEYIIVGKESATLEFDVNFKSGVSSFSIKKGMCGKTNLVTEEVKFTSKVQIPKSIMPTGGKIKHPIDNAIIAFPDDRPLALRPWRRTEEIKTIFARMPRLRCMKDEYTLSSSKEELKKRNQDYYQKYTKEEAEKLRKQYKTMCKSVSDYDITSSKKCLVTEFKSQSYESKKEILLMKKPSFIPLTPSELSNISVTPFMIQLEGIVPDSFANTAITVKNKNEFSIRVYIKSKKKGVVEFPKGNRATIRANSQENIAIKYKAEGVGRHFVAIEIIVNECSGCECTLQARVIPSFVSIDVNHLEFLSTETQRKYVKVTNPCNQSVTFTWENNTQSLSILPPKGTIPAKSFMYCKIVYVPVVMEKLASEIILTSNRNKNSKILLDVFATLVKPKVALSTSHLEIPLVPLNISIKRRIVLRNFGKEIVLFRVVNPAPIFGITITPSEGILRGFGDQIFSINICIPTCITFSCTVQIEVQKVDQVEFKISGSVEYPQVIVKPKNFNLRKVYLGCFDKFKFQVENVGKCTASVKFSFEYYSEFYVSMDPKKCSPVLQKEGIVLEPQEQKTLYLHFHPIDVAPNNFHLPIIVNDILGPSSKIRIDTASTSTYLSPGMNFYLPECAAVTEYPTKLHCTEVSNSVLCPVLQFSTLHFEFYKYTHVNKEAVDSLNFIVINVSQGETTFSIQLDSNNGPFLLKHLEGGMVETTNNRMTIKFNSKDKVILNAVFLPTSSGEYTNYFPVFLEGMADEPYNYIIMHGTLFAPTIDVPNPVIYMLPVPIGVTCESCFIANLCYHGDECSFSNKSVRSDLLISVYRKKSKPEENVDDDQEKLHVTVFHTASTVTEYAAEVVLECSCQASTTLIVKGAADNCILTTHIFRNVYCARDVIDHSDESLGRVSTATAYMFMPSDESIYSDTFSSIFPAGSPDDRRLDCSTCPYPLFPTENDPNYFRYMRKCLRILEMYIHKQCFCGKRFCKIPDDISAFPVDMESKDKKQNTRTLRKQKKQEDVLYLQILGAIAGADVLNKLKPEGDYPCDEVERVTYICTIYHNVLEHLKEKSAILSHVQAEYLLSYDDYEIYMRKNQLTENMIFGEEIFFRYSSQSWIDILLQTFKVYVLPNVKIPRRTSGTKLMTDKNEKDVRIKLEKAFIKWERITEMTEEEMETCVYEKCEVALLAWFRFIFQEYHHLILTHEGLATKHFSNFRDNFFDSLALIVVTAVYCPYLCNDLKNINVSPRTYEEAFHNACVLILAWGKVNISYHISPTELLLANELQLVLLSAYLYQVLPTLRPSETILMEAPLSQKTTKQISIKNSRNATVAYQVLFFENEKGYFTSNTESVVLRPKKSGSVLITYFAKKLLKTRCVLILSGETPGYKYAKNMAYYIEGVPDISYYEAVNHKLFTPYLYEYSTETVHICSPYKVAAVYNTFVHHGIPTDISKIVIEKNINETPIHKVLYNPSDQLFCDKDGHASTHPTICSTSTLNADFYIYYVNDEIGDFCMRLRVEPKTKRKNIYEVMSVLLPRGFFDLPCYCTDSHMFSLNCPKTLFALIPCRNNTMWSCMERMFVTALGEEQFYFWKKYLGTSAGIHLLHRFLQIIKNENDSFVKHTFNESVEYDVDLDSNFKGEVTLISSMVIDNTHSTDRIEFPIHINSCKTPHSFFCNLKSKDNLEYRFYKVNFICDAFTNIDSISNEDNTVKSETDT